MYSTAMGDILLEEEFSYQKVNDGRLLNPTP